MKVLTLLSVLFCASISVSYANSSKDTGVTATECRYNKDQLARVEIPAKKVIEKEEKKAETKVLPKS